MNWVFIQANAFGNVVCKDHFVQAASVVVIQTHFIKVYKMQIQLLLQWRHNERDGVSNHRRLDCLLNRLFRWRSKKTSKLRATGLCEGNSLVTGEFPAKGQLRGKCFHLMASSCAMMLEYAASAPVQLTKLPRAWPCKCIYRFPQLSIFFQSIRRVAHSIRRKSEMLSWNLCLYLAFCFFYPIEILFFHPWIFSKFKNTYI